MDLVFLMDRFGYVKSIDPVTYERNKEAADAESRFIFPCKNTGRICLFTNTGQLHTVKMADVPYGKFRDKGVPIDNISNYSSAKEELILVTDQTSLNLYRIVFVTRQAMMKIVDGGEFDVNKRTVSATKLSDGDELVNVSVLTDRTIMVLQTKIGYFLRFALSEIPEKKKTAVGVRGMKLSDDDIVEEVYYTLNSVDTWITYKEKQLNLNTLKPARRDTKGTKIRL